MPQDNENKELNDIIVIGVVAIAGYFGIIKPLLESVGILNNADDAIIKAQQTAPPIDNPFDLNWGVANADATTLTYQDVNDTIQYIHNSPQLGVDPLSGATITYMTEPYAQIAAQIYDSVGFLSGNEQQMIDALNKITNQYELWQVALYFDWIYQKDLLEFLKAGYPIFTIDNGMKKSELAQFIQKVNQMPLTYPPGTIYYK